MHRVVAAGLLPLLEFAWPPFVIDQLILGSGVVDRIVQRCVFDDRKEDPAIALGRDFPFDAEFKAVELVVREDVAADVSTKPACDELAVLDIPARY